MPPLKSLTVSDRKWKPRKPLIFHLFFQALPYPTAISVMTWAYSKILWPIHFPPNPILPGNDSTLHLIFKSDIHRAKKKEGVRRGMEEVGPSHKADRKETQAGITTYLPGQRGRE